MASLNPEFLRYIHRHLRTAGWHASQMRSGVEIKTKDAADDFVTQADKELDVMIGAALGKILPGCADFSGNDALTDGLITEERIEELSPTVARSIASRNRVWYLDPIDGTDNYMKQDGQYVVLLGVLAGGQPEYGWIYSPTRDELYFGGPSSELAEELGYVGLWCSKAGATPEPMAKTKRDEGFTAAQHLRAIMGSRDRRDHPEVAKQLRVDDWVSVGSVGLKVMAIISGVADVYIHCSQQLKFWDTVAPIALATGAGLTVCDLDGNSIKFNLHDAAVTQDVFRHRQTVLVGTPVGIATLRQRLQLQNLR